MLTFLNIFESNYVFLIVNEALDFLSKVQNEIRLKKIDLLSFSSDILILILQICIFENRLIVCYTIKLQALFCLHIVFIFDFFWFLRFDGTGNK
jgi:hypothetical protein